MKKVLVLGQGPIKYPRVQLLVERGGEPEGVEVTRLARRLRGESAARWELTDAWSAVIEMGDDDEYAMEVEPSLLAKLTLQEW